MKKTKDIFFWKLVAGLLRSSNRYSYLLCVCELNIMIRLTSISVKHNVLFKWIIINIVFEMLLWILFCSHNNFLCLFFTACFLKTFIQKWHFYALCYYFTSSRCWKTEADRYELIILKKSAVQYKIQVLQMCKLKKKNWLHSCVLDLWRNICFWLACLFFVFIFSRL